MTIGWLLEIAQDAIRHSGDDAIIIRFWIPDDGQGTIRRLVESDPSSPVGELEPDTDRYLLNEFHSSPMVRFSAKDVALWCEGKDSDALVWPPAAVLTDRYLDEILAYAKQGWLAIEEDSIESIETAYDDLRLLIAEVRRLRSEARGKPP